MGAVFYVMAILGCGDAGVACNEARIATPVYASAAECQADAENVLMANTDLDFPSLQADCRKSRKPASLDKQAPSANKFAKFAIRR